MLLETNTQRQEGKYPTIRILHCSILKLLFSQFSARPLQDKQCAICHTFIIRRLFLPTAMWASIYPPADALSVHM